MEAPAAAPDRAATLLAAASRLAAWVASASVCCALGYHVLRGSNAHLGLFEDDYFYYAAIADRLVTTGRLTYDGVTQTNGFHPLWLLLLAALRAVFGRFGPGFYLALLAVFFSAMVATYELSVGFARELGATARQAPVIAAAYSLGTARLLSCGMEAALAVPLLLLFLRETARQRPLTPRRAAALGMLASVAILARLDIALAVFLLIAGWLALARPSFSSAWRTLLAFFAGGVLVPAYAAANWLAFGSVLPMSALAKRLQRVPGFNLNYARAVALATVYGPVVGVVLPLGLASWFLLARARPAARPAALATGGLTIVFALTFYFLNALSGWVYFGWYAYPLAPALIAATVFLCRRWIPEKGKGVAAALAAAVLVLVPLSAARYFVEHGPRWTVADNSMLAMSLELKRRMGGREGLVGMGAIAGIAAHVLDRPVFQLEGVVGDRALIEHIRREAPLGSLLKDRGVDYLIVTLANEAAVVRDGCYLITQPNPRWSGNRVARMRGEICAEPVEHFSTPAGQNPWSTFPLLETLVFDLRGARWR